jgi:phenylalanyl-tRNA synthetase beta chain
VDFYDVVGILATLTERLGLPGFELVRETASPFLHPGRSATLRFAGDVAGFVGAVHPGLARRAELPDDVYAAELQLEPLLRARTEAARMQPIPRYPAVSRDVSMLCDAGAEAATFTAIARRAAGELLAAVTVADRYEGAPVPAGRISLMLSLRFQDPLRTLTSEEVDRAVARVTQALRESGAEIRGGE